MFKKRVIILFFTLFLFNLNGEESKNISDKKYIDEAYEKDFKIFFASGIIESESKSVNFSIYKEKNKFNKYNFSLLIGEKKYKIVSKKTDSKYYLNNKEIDKEHIIEELNIPLNILNYSLLNRDYLIISKPNKTKYKNIPCYKFLIKEKEKPEIPEITEKKIETPIKEDVDEATEEKTETPITEEADKTPSEESITDSQEVSDKNVTVVEEEPVIIKERKIVYEDALYPKVIYYLSANTSTVLKKEFYLDKENKLPDFIIQAEKVSFIKGKYMGTELNINDKKGNSLTFRYNIESILLEKKLIDKKFNKMIFFNGAD